MVNEAFCFEALEHFGDTGLGDAEFPGDIDRSGISVLIFFDELEDLF